MTFWIVSAVVVVVLGALAWWTSGRSNGGAIDPRRARIQSDAYRHSHETQARFDPGGPFTP
jgi:hypothetical protein